MAETKKNTAPGQDNAKNELKSQEPTASERFAVSIAKQFEAEAGSPVTFTDYERALAQHLFLCIDSTLKDFETKRNDPNKPEYSWANLNMRKLALDAVHIVQLGLDALVKAHVYPVPYLNGRTGKYDLDLRVGYRGKDYYRRNAAVDPPLDIRYELVYSNDSFMPKKKDFRNEVESYEFDISNPFDRGQIVGGFAYLMYKDPAKNKLVLVPESEFVKSQKSAKSQEFWGKYPTEMRFKTLVHRATEQLTVDPKKTNAAAYAYVEARDDEAEGRADRIAAANANGAAIVIDSEFEDERPAQPTSIPQPSPAPAADAGPGF